MRPERETDRSNLTDNVMSWSERDTRRTVPLERKKPAADPVILLEDRLAEMDARGSADYSREARQRLAHGLGACVVALVILAWTLYAATPSVAQALLHA